LGHGTVLGILDYCKMKKLTIIILGVVALTLSAAAVDKAALDKKIEKLTAKFEALQQKPDKRIPPEVLQKAQGIILLDRTKAGFVVAYQGGGGVAMVKDRRSGKWGAPAFFRANEGSIGFQVGGQQSFFVIVMMNAEGTRLLTDPSFELGGEAQGTAGDQSAGAEAGVSNVERPVLVYSDRQGLFGGAALKGGALSPDEEANRVYYEQPIAVKEILFEKLLKPSEPAQRLAQKLSASAITK
jgi:lipid-binding SYLF domain-containing protein